MVPVDPAFLATLLAYPRITAAVAAVGLGAADPTVAVAVLVGVATDPGMAAGALITRLGWMDSAVVAVAPATMAAPGVQVVTGSSSSAGEFRKAQA